MKRDNSIYEIYLTDGMFGEPVVRNGLKSCYALCLNKEDAVSRIDKFKRTNLKQYKVEPYCRIISGENGKSAVDFGDYSTFFVVEPVHHCAETLAALKNADFGVFGRIASYVRSTPDSAISVSEYPVNGKLWTVCESSTWKCVENSACDYHFFFSKTDGFTLRFGKTVDEDPAWCELGPEIMDIEVVAGRCPKINGRNCAFCYKNNGGETARCMTFEQFEKMFGAFPKNLTQIAFGITGYYTNPDYGRILEFTRRNGVIPNYTTNGVDLDDAAVEHTLDCCGRVAVSCYDGAKEICYQTIKRFGDAAKKRGMNFPCNIHLVVSKGTIGHVMDVLNDAKNGVIENLGSIVLLRMKPVGRAACLDSSVPLDMYRDIVKFCMESGISFGFDSCGAKSVEKVLREFGREDLVSSVEPCESTRMSFYVSCEGRATPCSFCEHAMEANAVDMYSIGCSNEFIDMWNGNEMIKTFRKGCIGCERSCQMYDLD